MVRRLEDEGRRVRRLAELRKLLGTMSDVEKKAKGVEKSLGIFAAPIAKAVAEAKRLSDALAGIKTRAGGVERDFARWGKAAGKSATELRGIRTTLDGVRTSARTVSSSMGTWSGGIGRANRQLQGTVTALTRASRAAATINVGGGGAPPGATGRRARNSSFNHGVGFGAGMGTGDAALHGAARAGRTGIEYAGEGVTEKLKQRNAGMTPAEQARLQNDSFKLSAQHPSFSPLAIQEIGRNLLANVDTAAKMFEVLPTYVEAGVSLQTSRGTEGAVKELDLLGKAIDNLGRSTSLTSTRNVIDGHLKTAQVDKAATAADLLNFSKTSQSSGKSMSDEWLRDVYPTLAFGMGGSRTGTSVATAQQNMDLGRATKEALLAQSELGLRTGLTLGKEKSGRRVVKDKGGLVDSELYNSNNKEWNDKYLMPKLVEKGYLPKGYLTGDYSEELTS